MALTDQVSLGFQAAGGQVKALRKIVTAVRPPSGQNQPPDGLVSVTTSGSTSGSTRFLPITLIKGCPYAGLAVNVTTAGVFSTAPVYTCKLGLYGENAAGSGPDVAAGPLFQGDVAVTATGLRLAAFSLTPVETRRYWAAYLYTLTSGAWTTTPALTTVLALEGLWGTSPTLPPRALAVAGATTALPRSGAVTADTGGSSPVIWAQAA